MTNLLALLSRPLTSAAQDESVGALVSYTGALLIFVLGVFTIARLQLTEAQLVFGLFLVLCVAMQMVACGLLLGIHRRLATTDGKDARGQEQ